jgi:hypothetical protein
MPFFDKKEEEDYFELSNLIKKDTAVSENGESGSQDFHTLKVCIT